MKTIFYRARDVPLLFSFLGYPKNNNLILKGNLK